MLVDIQKKTYLSPWCQPLELGPGGLLCQSGKLEELDGSISPDFGSDFGDMFGLM